jgi:hypothetical protein|tara:strand:+ start:322 stop:540 length:219 start_codon:yes stop_codon:yes gene_type:complete
MSKLKNIAYDMAEETIDETIEKIIRNDLTYEQAVKELTENTVVMSFFNLNEIEIIIAHELKKEVYYGGVCEH